MVMVMVMVMANKFKLIDGGMDEVQLPRSIRALVNQPSAPNPLIAKGRDCRKGCTVAKKLVK